jgi:hypothetical protein
VLEILAKEANMLKPTLLLFISGAVLGAAGVAARAQNPAENVVVGDARVETLSSYTGTDSLPKPDKLLVYDFIVPPGVVTPDESLAARFHREHTLLRGGDDESSPEAVARQVQAGFSKALAGELQKASLPVEVVPSADTAIPPHALIIQGEFIAVNDGNRSKRATIGFGRGASDVQAHVSVSLATEAQPIMLSEFKLKSESGEKPGPAATMGSGSGAAGAATGRAGDKKATVEADASRIAKAVAKQVEEVMASQHWIPPQPPKAQ